MELEDINLEQEVYKYYDENKDDLLTRNNDELYAHFYYVSKKQHPTLREYKKRYKQECAKVKISDFYRKKEMVRYIEKERIIIRPTIEDEMVEVVVEEDDYEYNEDFNEEIERCWDEKRKHWDLSDHVDNPEQEYHLSMSLIVEDITFKIPKCPPEQIKDWLWSWNTKNHNKRYFFK